MSKVVCPHCEAEITLREGEDKYDAMKRHLDVCESELAKKIRRHLEAGE